MKLLLFSDVHVNKAHCNNLLEKSKDVDVVIGAGDFGNIKSGLEKTIDWLSRISKPALLVPGNAESYQELKEACQIWGSAIVLHGSSAVISGVTFFGIGGGIPVTPFGPWSYDFTEAQAKGIMEKCTNNAVIISHSPPSGILDKSSLGKHLGSTTILEAIKKYDPPLLVCGHIHESSGKMQRHLNTDVINAGPLGMNYTLKP